MILPLLNDSPKQPPLIDFYPFAYALFDECLGRNCWYCLDEERQHKRCTGCQRAFFCDKKCQSLAWKDHKFECRGIKALSGNVPDIEVRLLGRIVARHKAILYGLDKKDPDFYTDRTSRRNIMDIWAHTKKIEKDEFAMRKFEDIYGRLCQFYDAKALLSKQTIFELHCRDFINRHAISDAHYLREIGKGLYLDLCAYDHSCRPNTVYSCRSFIATLRPLNTEVNLLDRSATFYSYIDLLCAKQDRRKLLKDTWYFTCECERCMDESEHVLTAMLCPNCPASNKAPTLLCIFGQHDYKDAETQMITCPCCGQILAKEQVLEAISAMRFLSDVLEKTDLEKMTKQEAINFLEELLEKFGQMLPSVNVYLCKIVQALLPLVDQNDSKRLLELHLQVERCIRVCYPPNHPALAFHLRNIGIFAKCLGKKQMTMRYLREAQEMFKFVMGMEHSLTSVTSEILEEVEGMKEEETTTKEDNENGVVIKKAAFDEEKLLEKKEVVADAKIEFKKTIKKKGKADKKKNEAAEIENFIQDDAITREDNKKKNKKKRNSKNKAQKSEEASKVTVMNQESEEAPTHQIPIILAFDTGVENETLPSSSDVQITVANEHEIQAVQSPTQPVLIVPDAEENDVTKGMQQQSIISLDVPSLSIDNDADNPIENNAADSQTEELFLQIGQTSESRPVSALSLSAASANSLSPAQAEGGTSPGGSGVKKKLHTKKTSPRARTPMYPRANEQQQAVGGEAAEVSDENEASTQQEITLNKNAELMLEVPKLNEVAPLEEPVKVNNEAIQSAAEVEATESGEQKVEDGWQQQQKKKNKKCKS